MLNRGLGTVAYTEPDPARSVVCWWAFRGRARAGWGLFHPSGARGRLSVAADRDGFSPKLMYCFRSGNIGVLYDAARTFAHLRSFSATTSLLAAPMGRKLSRQRPWELKGAARVPGEPGATPRF